MSSFSDSVKNELSTMESKVRHILAEHPRARDNDTYLEWLVLRDYLKAQGFDLPWIEYEPFIRILTFKFETVRRVRQKIQATGDFPASDSVAVRRQRKQASVKAWVKGSGVSEYTADPGESWIEKPGNWD